MIAIRGPIGDTSARAPHGGDRRLNVDFRRIDPARTAPLAQIHLDSRSALYISFDDGSEHSEGSIVNVPLESSTAFLSFANAYDAVGGTQGLPPVAFPPPPTELYEAANAPSFVKQPAALAIVLRWLNEPIGSPEDENAELARLKMELDQDRGGRRRLFE